VLISGGKVVNKLLEQFITRKESFNGGSNVKLLWEQCSSSKESQSLNGGNENNRLFEQFKIFKCLNLDTNGLSRGKIVSSILEMSNSLSLSDGKWFK
jgi:hypothetical protein